MLDHVTIDGDDRVGSSVSIPTQELEAIEKLGSYLTISFFRSLLNETGASSFHSNRGMLFREAGDGVL